MEKDSGFWFHQHHLHLPSPNPNLLGCPFDIGLLNNQPVCMNSYFVGDSTPRTVPSCPVPRLLSWKGNEPNVSSNWFNSIPQSHETLTTVFNSSSNEKLSTGQVDLRGQTSPTTVTAPAQKIFLVFDQSGDKTTMIYSSGVENAAQCGNHWIPTPPTTYNLNKAWPLGGVSHFRPITKDECGEDKLRDDMKDEMHEDTEELNALLYSDNDSDFSEDEETSTGHSPSTMTDNGVRDSDEETGEEVDSSAAPSKRQKLLSGGFNVLPNINATTFVKTSAVSAFDDDAESGSGTCRLSVENGSSSGGKRSRKERIRATVSILQNIIPNMNGKDKDTIVVIDEAIHYLKSLKVQAMALGLDTL